jgi:hypothetical protein
MAVWTDEEYELHSLWESAVMASPIMAPSNHKQMKRPWENPAVHPETRAMYVKFMEEYKPTYRRNKKMIELYRAGHLSVDETIDLMHSPKIGRGGV